MIVEATPEVVYFTASKEKETPKNGPNKAPMIILFIAETFITALFTRDQNPV